MPCPCHAPTMLLFSRPQHSTAVSRRPCCAVTLRRTAWHGKCESDTAALCKSNGEDTFQTLRGTAWQGNGTGAAWERHAMCESALTEAALWLRWHSNETISSASLVWNIQVVSAEEGEVTSLSAASRDVLVQQCSCLQNTWLTVGAPDQILPFHKQLGNNIVVLHFN